MRTQLCPQCVYISTSDKFCEHCGLSKEAISTAQLETPPADLLPEPAPATPLMPLAPHALPASHDTGWLKMLDVTGKVTGLGTPLAAVFDFLSPRVALFPIAATVAVVGLLAAVALRKFVAPSLPATSKFRMALAPEAGLHRSRMVIGTGMLSALMVTGAAWSNANAPEGGVIASKFDAAKSAQMQLGILQAVQKEQRVQTAVLEDIREGRTLNPRRELSNQGILWTQRAFKDAVYSDDAAVVSLFIAGGMRWGAETGFDLLVAKKNAISDLLISRPELFDRDIKGQYRRGCYDFVQFFNQPSDETEDLKESNRQKAYLLRSQDKQWLKTICGDKEGQATVQAMLQDQINRYSVPSTSQCRDKLLDPLDGVFARIKAGYHDVFPFEIEASETLTLHEAFLEQVRKDAPESLLKGYTLNMNGRDLGLKPVADQKISLTPTLIGLINDYCGKVSYRYRMEINGWRIESIRQIVAALN